MATSQKTPAKKRSSSSTRSAASAKRKPSASSSPNSAAARKKAQGGRGGAKGGTGQASTGSSAWHSLVDGHGRDIWGLIAILAAVVLGVSIYSQSSGGVANWPGSATAALVGLLRVFLPPALVLAGVLLIRSAHVHSDESASERAEAPADSNNADSNKPQGRKESPSRAVQAIGALLALFVVAGMLDLFFEEGASISADGLGAYSSGGGLLGAFFGSLALLLGRWGAVVVLLVLGVLSVSLLTGWSLSYMAQSVIRAAKPAAQAAGNWAKDLFNLGSSDRASQGQPAEGGSAGEQVELEVNLYDQDDGAAPQKKRPRSKKTTESGPTVVVSGPKPFTPPGEGSEEPVAPEQLGLGLGPAAVGSAWRLPPKNLLSLSGKRTVDTKAVEARGRVLEGALAEHGVETRLVGMVVGPTVTRYELELGVGVKVARLTSLHKDIAYAMASPDVRILAPIPGRQAIGVEVPNKDRQIVNLGDILTSEEAHRATHPLEVGVGRDISGTSVLMNLATMPHLLIAGQTGAGKSSCINSIITSILMRSTPDQVRMILIDPKQVELTQYNRIPHLLTQVVTNPKKAANALNWAVHEMERRYDLLSEVGVRDITGYNASFDRGDLQQQLGEDREFKRMPFILVVVDELADLMMVASREVEESITRIAAKARAVGIHLVIATQRPSVNVITGVIKANIPARLAFAVASSMDSKVILDQTGAERLVGRGDMLLLGGTSSSAQRIQGSWVEESEVSSIVNQWRKQAPAVEEHYVEGVAGDDQLPSGGSTLSGGTAGDDDDLMHQAMELVVRSGLGSTSMLQRKLKVGFARAGRLMDLLEQRGVVGPSEGSKARTVMISPEELDDMIERGEF